MDKFEEMMQKMAKMTDAERTMMMDKNKVLCICGKCPTYNDCAKEKTEILYCVTGKSACTLSKTGCICPACPITPMLGLKHAYYCTNGSEPELRGM
ncbi:MAG: DUF2769 domain-containing protein [Methanoregula sp.]|nr:MAG: DUF2769 domain-containing protein [Methanoregula sp.]